MRDQELQVETFKIHIPEVALTDLHRRLDAVRWPDELPVHDWSRGVPAAYMKELAAYWRGGFDWRAQEERLNGFPQYTTEIDGQRIHFLHVRSPEPDALPLIITHGYPGSIAEFMNIIGPLADPRAHGGDPSDAFHIVAPSLPGFGFSTPLRDTGWEAGRTARAWAELMSRLGYDSYGAQGGDIGAGVAGDLGRIDAEHVVGVHVNTDADAAVAFADPGAVAALSDEDRETVQRMQAIWEDRRGYIAIQSTRPQTIAYSLTDSPVGQLAWIVEKFQEWTDPAAERPQDAVDLDQLLTNISIYWFTKSGATAANFLWEAFHAVRDWGAPGLAPVGWAAFGGEKFIRKLVDPEGKIKHWTDYPRGRHFAAMEAPDLLVADVRTFFRGLRR